VVTICTASLTFTYYAFCPHSVFVCFVGSSEQTAIISLYSINWLVFYNRDGVCLLRGTDWIFVFFLWISEQTAIISLYSINWLVCITETESVYCAVRTGYVFCVDLRTYSHYFPIQHELTGLYNRDWVCLLRGTDWMCVLCGFQNKQRLFPYTALTDWFL